MSSKTSVRDFYSNKTVFVTGSTGFLGKFIVEKLLSSTNVSKVYILIRPKRGSDIEERFKKYKADEIFKFRTPEHMLERLAPVAGDITSSHLGIDPVTEVTLASNVDIVLHSAATVRFNELLSDAMHMNVCGTMEVLNLCKKMTKLKAMIYVSTAFANSHLNESGERFRPISVDPYKLIIQMKDQDEDTFNTKTYQSVIGDHPNTYTFTKNLSEQIVKDQSIRFKLPSAIVRPSIIIAPSDRTLEFYIDCVSQGSTALIANYALGLNRVLPGSYDNIMSVIPVDKVANSILVAAWKVAMDHIDAKLHRNNNIGSRRSVGNNNDSDSGQQEVSDYDPKIYGLYSDSFYRYPLGELNKSVAAAAQKYPSMKTVRPPSQVILTSKDGVRNKVYNFIFNILFARLFDIFFVLSGQKIRLTKLMNKSIESFDTLRFFMANDWNNEGHKFMDVVQELSQEERSLYFCEDEEITDHSQEDFLVNYWLGIRKWALKESLDNLKKARTRLARLSLIYNTVSTMIVSCLALLLASFLKNLFINDKNVLMVDSIN